MYGWLNLGSLILGLLAWTLPLISMMRNGRNNSWVLHSIFSLSACATSLFLQIYYQYHLVTIEDWAALMDTTRAVTFASASLLGGTLFLNGITFLVYRNKRK